MPAEHKKPDPATRNGVGRSLRGAFAPDSPVDPELEGLIRKTDGVYIPDEVSDRRVNQLLQRLQDLPWGAPGAH